MSDLENLEDYKFDSPLLITKDKFIKPQLTDWESGYAWVKYLGNISGILGIVMPLELKTSRFTRQDLLGVELLTWLRYSDQDNLKRLPVLAASFQPLEQILQLTLNLLLVVSGTKFFRLPDALEYINEFDKAIRDENQRTSMSFCATDLDRIASAGGGIAEAVTYHDLANNYFNAYRLWVGYKLAINTAMKSMGTSDAKVLESKLDEVNSKTNNLNKWEDEKIRPLLIQPHIQQYLTLVRKRPTVPLYPIVTQGNQVVLRHIKEGLPSTTRILIVDDEFDKGLGEVLLQILFGQQKTRYTQKGEAEWIYSEETDKGKWARLVCVKSTDAANHWLTYWGNLNASKSAKEQYWNKNKKWYVNWAETLGVNMSGHKGEAEPGEALRSLDKYQAQPKGVNTVVLLDLRLETGEQQEPYAPQELSSIKLLKLIKQQENPVPVIMNTASRQAMNYAIAMESASMFDGWLTKEGPDMGMCDTNSIRAVHYLLERFHEFACTHEWYREELEWEPKWKHEYARLRSHLEWDKSIKLIANVASNLFAEIQKEEFHNQYKAYCKRNKNSLDKSSSATGLGWADAWEDHNHTGVFTITDSLERRLALRRVVVAALLATANWSVEAKPTWDCELFDKLIPSGSKQDVPRYVSEVVTNFKEKLWFTTHNPKLIAMLLREEYEWLLNKFTQCDNPTIHMYVAEVMNKKFPANKNDQ